MAYHTGHRADCDLSADPIECFCGDYSALPSVPRSAKDYARHMCIGVDLAASEAKSESVLIVRRVDEDAERNPPDEIYSVLCLQIVHGRVHALLKGKQDHSRGIFG